jgi:4-diphosphocytidyl-2-C-methyl-D-erythritol kinase
LGNDAVPEFTHAIETALGSAPGELAFAKVNLALHVLGRRTDGYHSLESLVVFADYGDVLTAGAAPEGRMRLSVKGDFADVLRDTTRPEDNLVIRAATELARAAGKAKLEPKHLELVKRIPVAAGLGGGSADAAAALRLLNRAWQTGLSDARLAEIGRRLGADVPMCVTSRPLVAAGIGERITPVRSLPALPIVLAHPGVPVATADVFRELPAEERSGLPPLPAKFLTLLEVVFWLRQARNDLAEPAARVARAAAAPARALMRDPDCMFARMSGSGAAAFGIFINLGAAERAAERLSTAKPDWWVVAAQTIPA